MSTLLLGTRVCGQITMIGENFIQIGLSHPITNEPIFIRFYEDGSFTV